MGYLADELKRVKRITGLSSAKWGELAGVSGSTIDQICAGNRSASASTLSSLAIASGTAGSAEAFMCAKIADELNDVIQSARPEQRNTATQNALEKFLLWGGLRQHDTANTLELPEQAVAIVEKAVKLGISAKRVTMLPSSDKPTQYSMDFVINDSQEG
jgi:transcriptional regulator with XRE-family HTH domain